MQPVFALIAAVSRLIDLHDSRRSPGSDNRNVPPSRASYEHSAYYLSLGVATLETFYRLERADGVGGFYSKDHIASALIDVYGEYDEADVDFCLRMLSVSREIHFTRDEDGIKGSTADKTQLLKRSVGEYGQYALTDNARLFLRVSSDTENWFYEGDDAGRLVRAINKGLFQDIPVLCRQRIDRMIELSKKITFMKERIAIEGVSEEFHLNRPAFEETLEDARCAIEKAIKMLQSDEAEIKFDEWKARSGSEYTLMAIMGCLQVVAKANQNTSRNLIDFVSNIHKYKAAGMGIVDFHGLANNIIRSKRVDIKTLDDLYDIVMPQMPHTPSMHPFDFAESIRLDEAKEERKHFVVDLDEPGNEIEERFTSFIDNNKEWFIKTLQDNGGSLRFSKLIASGKFTIFADENPATLFGYVASPEFLTKHDIHISLALDGTRFETKVEYFTVYGDDILITLLNKTKEH